MDDPFAMLSEISHGNCATVYESEAVIRSEAKNLSLKKVVLFERSFAAAQDDIRFANGGALSLI
jgi:hypothetical protein